jgi:acetyl esterase/lipase
MAHRIVKAAVAALAIAGLLASAGCVWMASSPYPGVYLVRHTGAFSAVPPSPRAEALLAGGQVRVQRDLDYAPGQGNADTRLDLYRPAAADGPLPVVVWVHGGGFIDGTKQGVAGFLPLLAAHGHAGVALEYSKAPEHAYPTQTRQVLQALAWLRTNAPALGIDPHRIVLGGDSAGAHIAAQAALAVARPDYAQATGLAAPLPVDDLRGVLLFSGTYNFVTASKVDVAPAMAKFARLVRWSYLGEKDPDPAGPVRWTTLQDHVDRRFPPTLIVAGNGDPLAPQSIRMARALERAGVPTDWRYVDGGAHAPVPHEFQFDYTRADAAPVLQATLDALDRWSGAARAQ